MIVTHALAAALAVLPTSLIAALYAPFARPEHRRGFVTFAVGLPPANAAYAAALTALLQPLF